MLLTPYWVSQFETNQPFQLNWCVHENSQAPLLKCCVVFRLSDWVYIEMNDSKISALVLSFEICWNFEYNSHWVERIYVKVRTFLFLYSNSRVIGLKNQTESRGQQTEYKFSNYFVLFMLCFIRFLIIGFLRRKKYCEIYGKSILFH